ncbi:MAG: aminotransferase class I/II-fold pyridoxal phosphate-dependent enzyme [Acidobacteriota bacterium]
MDQRERRPRVRIRHHPETAAIADGFDPALSVMAARPPIYPVSTYCFHSAAEAKAYFDSAMGRGNGDTGHGLIYARLNNPNAEIFEDQLVPLEKGAMGAVSFTSGMAAITGAFLAFLRPGDVVLAPRPVYGGTEHVLHELLPPFGITAHFVPAGDTAAMERAASELGSRLAMVYVESPANPTLVMTDIAAAAVIAHRERGHRRAMVVVDNTFLGPVFQSPLIHGADLVLYSATKYIGGHSDLVAGVALASDPELLVALRGVRTFFGTICEPFTAWLLTRSLATIYTRTIKQSKNASRIVEHLSGHPKLLRLHYPTLIEGEQRRIYKSQCTAPGGMLALELRGGRDAAFRFLDALRIPKLAVSLGGVESLATHPRTTTSSEMSADELDRSGITEGMVRYSVGVEYWRDLVRDIESALEQA